MVLLEGYLDRMQLIEYHLGISAELSSVLFYSGFYSYTVRI